MVEHFPEFIDPLMLAEKRCQFKGSLLFTKMPGLQDVLMNLEGGARFELSFGKNGKFATVTGLVEAKLQLQCQCCLGPIPWDVSSRVSLGVVRSLEEADLLPENYEPLLLEEDTIPLADIVQAELLLAVPSIPQHEQCGPGLGENQERRQEAPKRPNPFAVLAKLKTN